MQVAFFIYQLTVAGTTLPIVDRHDALRLQRRRTSQSVASLLVYRSDKQRQLWRFVLYMLVHAGYSLQLKLHLLRSVADLFAQQVVQQIYKSKVYSKQIHNKLSSFQQIP